MFCARFLRRNVSLGSYSGLCKRMGWMTGRTGCFEKGLVPHNKGKPHDHPSCRATRFKKGAVPANITPMWTERTDREGYVELKVPERNPHTGHKTRYVHKHRYLWEKKNGPLPAGHVLKSLDGDKANTDPSNWVAIPRALLPRLAGGPHGNLVAYDSAPPELKPTLLALANLEHAAREARE